VNAAEHRALLTSLSEILSTHDFDRLDQVYAPDVVVEYPQSSERFRGIENVRGQFTNYPGGELESEVSDIIGGDAYALTPMYTVVAVDGSGDRGTAIFRSKYPDGSFWWVVNVYEVVNRRLAKVRVFFGPEFDAPEWRAPYWDKP
jgi:ketosteroid isomerase-like protein